MAYYATPIRVGLDRVLSLGDGETINLKWFQAYPTVASNKIAYHIYYSTDKDFVYSEGVKYVSIDGSLEANIINLTPGQDYYFSIRPVEYNPITYDLNSILPIAYDNLRFYPQSLLRESISATDLLIPLMDIEGFPLSGIIKIGVELIQYSSIDIINNNLILNNIDQRGFRNTNARLHTTSGYDGYSTWDPKVVLFTDGESTIFDRIFSCQSRFEYPNYQFNMVDGYHQVLKDILTTDLSESDDYNITFPTYDYSGYHRTDPVQLLNGACVGSYIGGEMGCIDGYGNLQIYRGFSLQEQNNQRQEILLSLTGRRAVLIQRVRTGITCPCYLASSEYPDDRCPLCNGGKFLLSYQQYFNPRESDGRILVRVGPADEDLKMYEAGLESEFQLDLWTLTVPTIKDRDIIVLFDMNGNEEFRYEVLYTTRNNTLLGLQGGQKLRVQRIRKTDPAYQVRIFRDTSQFPSKLTTSIGSAIPGIPFHTHEIVISEKIVSVTQINQITSISFGHSHSIVNGVIQNTLNHNHEIILI